MCGCALNLQSCRFDISRKLNSGFIILTALFDSGIAFLFCFIPLPEESTSGICHFNAGVEYTLQFLFALTFCTHTQLMDLSQSVVTSPVMCSMAF